MDSETVGAVLSQSAVTVRWRGVYRLAHRLFLPVFSIVLLFDLVTLARRFALGTDELMARVSAQTTSFLTMMHLLRVQPVNVDAPVFPILNFWSARLPIPIDIAIRLPAMACLGVAMWAMYMFVRKELSAGAGWVAATLLPLSPYGLYSIKARPYTPLLAGLALSLLCWHCAAKARTHRSWWTAALTGAILLAMCSHYFAGVSLLFIGLAEILYLVRKRHFRAPVWTAFVCSAILFAPIYFVYAPAGVPYHTHSFDAPVPEQLDLSWKSLYSTKYLSALGALVLLQVMVIMLRKRRKPAGARWPSPEFLLVAAGFTAAPYLLYQLALAVTNMYAQRYGIGGLLGFALFASLVTHLIARGRWDVQVAACLGALFVYQTDTTQHAFTPPYNPKEAWISASPAVLTPHSNLPVMIPDFDFAMRTRFYGPPWLSKRLTMMESASSMLHYTKSDGPSLAMQAISRWTGWPLRHYEDVRKNTPEFLLYGEYWAYDAIRADGGTITPISKVGPYNLYHVIFTQNARSQ